MKVAQKKSRVENTPTITIKDGKTPVSGAHVLLIAEDSTFFDAYTEENGTCIFKDLPTQSYSIYISHPSHPGHVIDGYRPNKDLEILIAQNDNVGSLIVVEGTGYIPGLEGRLNPILDTSDRTYLYANNIAINGGENQPVTFEIGKPITLRDKHREVFAVLFLRIKGRTSLLQYKKVGSFSVQQEEDTAELSVEIGKSMSEGVRNKDYSITLPATTDSNRKNIFISVLIGLIVVILALFLGDFYTWIKSFLFS